MSEVNVHARVDGELYDRIVLGLEDEIGVKRNEDQYEIQVDEYLFLIIGRDI